MLAQMSVRILNKEQLGEQSYIIIYTEAIASIIIFLILIGILIYNFYRGKIPSEIINEPPTDLTEENEDDD